MLRHALFTSLLASLSLAALAAPGPAAPAADPPAAPFPTLELRALDAAPGDGFGLAVAVDAELVVVGAPGDDDLGPDRGAAYVFDRHTGAQRLKLAPADLAGWQSGFGLAVAIDAGVIVVGTVGGSWESGAAYAFDAATGTQRAKLTPASAAPGQAFGVAVAVRGMQALVGAWGDDQDGSDAGAAFLFDLTIGQQVAALRPNDGQPGKLFGTALAISGTTAIVGAPLDDQTGFHGGAAYLFDLTTGAQLAKLLPADPSHQHFGRDVDLSGDRALVGAPYAAPGLGTGAAYVLDAQSGAQLAKLVAGDGVAGSWAGNQVAWLGDTAAVGAPADDDVGSPAPSVRAFDAASGLELARPAPVGPSAGSFFGAGLAAQGTTLVAGAPGAEAGAGVAFVFERPLGTAYCTAAPNSVSIDGAHLFAFGSASVGVGRLVLSAEGVPGQTGTFFYGPSQAAVPFGDGFRCVGGPLRRLESGVADDGGVLATALDFAHYGADLAALGTVHFQGWYRDPDSGSAGFNLTDGRTIEFVP